jgi:hypothetical protein
VRRFRKLREALTACGARDGWAAAAFELAADTCAAAGDTAELLKCLQGLVNSLYPAIAAAGAARATARGGRGGWPSSGGGGARGPGAGGGGAGGRGSDPAPAAAAAEAAAPAPASPRAPPLPGLAREGEVHGALLLWFLCVPARPLHAEVAKRLRALPPRLLGARDVRLALAAVSAAMRGNWVRLAAARAAAPPLVAFVLDAGAPAARARAARAAAVAYRSLPRAALAGALWLGSGGGDGGGACSAAALRDALVAARDGLGCRGAGAALADLDAALAGGGGGGDELRFR